MRINSDLEKKKYLCEINYVDIENDIKYVKDLVLKNLAFTYYNPIEIIDYIEGIDYGCIYYTVRQ